MRRNETITEDRRGELAMLLVDHSKSYIAALAVVYGHAVESGLPQRVAEEYVLMVIRTMEAAS